KKAGAGFVAAMLGEGEVLGPIADSRGVVLGNYTVDTTLLFEYDNYRLPLKRQFFPQCEVLATWDDAGMRETADGIAPRVVFGARPCDTRSLLQLDKVFTDENSVDPYFERRRKNTLIISLACSNPAATCFCTSTSGGPAGTDGSDIIAFTLEKVLLFKAITDKGTAFLKKNSTLFREASAEEIGACEQQANAAEEKLALFHVSAMPDKLHDGPSPEFWDDIARTCLSCGACAFLCPTCHCFDLHDEQRREGGERIRVHDTCMFESFVKEASGHNPRSKTGLRMKQRILHKFSYLPENAGEIFCVGCGRCVSSCPSGIDIRETISKVTI
ncbi:MAG: 4Fe-4S dicluster domain-containing protein, partial [Chitinispirillaceae bacterium]|nr:4Fe-4S dicluster domain-containing protein [Chitinispirillaceae bacterium]